MRLSVASKLGVCEENVLRGNRANTPMVDGVNGNRENRVIFFIFYKNLVFLFIVLINAVDLVAEAFSH